MLIPKQERKKIHLYLFKEGTAVAKKDFEIEHEDIGTKNLYVIKALQSLNSRGYVKTQFSWQHYYYTLTDAGVEYLREWLHLPSAIVPDTHKKQARQQMQSGAPDRSDRRGHNDNEGGYRRRDKDAAPGEFHPQFN